MIDTPERPLDFQKAREKLSRLRLRGWRAVLADEIGATLDAAEAEIARLRIQSEGDRSVQESVEAINRAQAGEIDGLRAEIAALRGKGDAMSAFNSALIDFIAGPAPEDKPHGD